MAQLHALYIFTLFSVVLVGSHAALLSSQNYWKSVLPNTPIPKAVRDLLPHSEYWVEDKSTSVDVGKGGVQVDAGKGTTAGGGGGTNVDVGGKGVGVVTGKPDKATNVGVGKGGVFVHTGPKTKPVVVGVHPGPNPFNYLYAASESQLNDDPNVALFFQQKDLQQGKTMSLHFIKSTKSDSFVPRHIADTIPFSSNKFSQILNQFSLSTNSEEATVMKKTIDECEEPSIKGEEKYCATSLESMIDFSTSKLGKKVHAISTEVQKETAMQKYTIVGVKKMDADKSVACHKQDYAYPVFYCHKTNTIKAYSASLLGSDGTRVKAVAVCHTDTSKWNPKHLAFQVLKVKPGTVPVCHFLPEDHVVWVPY